MSAKAILQTLILFLIGIYLPQNAYSFSKGGHKIAAVIAHQQMTAERRGEILRILAEHPRYQIDFLDEMPSEIADGRSSDREQWLFGQAAIWPDLARNFPGDERRKYHRGGWHFINLPIYLQDSDEEELSDDLGVNLSKRWRQGLDEMSLNAVQVLDWVKKTFADEETSDAERAVQICWVMHIIGDLHQPLHTTALFSQELFPRGDKGGNSVTVRTSRLGGTTNLHSLWDGLLGKDISFNTVKRRAFEATSDEYIRSQAESGVSVTSPWNWAIEGSEYSRDYVYSENIRSVLIHRANGGEREIILYSDYKSEAGEIAKMRVAVGGYRLAAFLGGLVE